jgi:hypothetical protein
MSEGTILVRDVKEYLEKKGGIEGKKVYEMNLDGLFVRLDPIKGYSTKSIPDRSLSKARVVGANRYSNDNLL